VAEPRPAEGLTGRLLAGRYRLTDLLATGGMAQVWEAADEVLARKVAVKVLHPHLAADQQFVERFRREAIAAARLAHPAIVSIFDTCSDDGTEAIVMELVRGTTLRHLLDERHHLEPGQAVAIAAQVADALEVAHKAGIVHRDIKPANILLSDDGRVLVADFGIAKAGEDMTNTGVTLGTAKYLAPEQVEGGAIDARADVYALGVVLYEALCGRAPFQADTEAATALARLHRDPLRPRNVRAGIPKPIEDVVLRAMARDPAQRYASGGALRAALLAATRGAAGLEPLTGSLTGSLTTSLAGSPLSAMLPDGEETQAVAAVDHTPVGAVLPAGAPPVRYERRWVLPTVIIAVLAAVIIVAGLLLRSRNDGNGVGSALGGGSAAGTPATITRAQAFDPFGGDGEHDSEAPFVLDGDESTTWSTSGYNDRRFGTKPGVGLVVVLDRSASLKDVKITSPTNDWSVEIYAADQPAAELAGWGTKAAAKQGLTPGTTSIDLGGAKGAAVLIWITDLGDEPAPTHARIAEVHVDAQ
jgi:eukaryotic-like serine/threonine-protein kinase